MNNYKVKWTEKTKNRKVEKWKYQCEELEDLYRDHMKEIEEKDEDLETDLQELQDKLLALEEKELADE